LIAIANLQSDAMTCIGIDCLGAWSRCHTLSNLANNTLNTLQNVTDRPSESENGTGTFGFLHEVPETGVLGWLITSTPVIGYQYNDDDASHTG